MHRESLHLQPHSLGRQLYTRQAIGPLQLQPQAQQVYNRSSTAHCSASGSSSRHESPREQSTQASQPNEERFLDVAELLKDNPADLVFEEDHDEGEIWGHEKRFIRQPPQSAQSPGQIIKGALDASQADILSAYSTEQGFREMSVEELASDMQTGNADLTVLDVRSAEEYSQGHIAGSRNISIDRLSDAVRAGELDSSTQFAVICARGGRSSQASVRLTKVFKFEKVVNIRGGMLEWEAKGLPVIL